MDNIYTNINRYYDIDNYQIKGEHPLTKWCVSKTIYFILLIFELKPICLATKYNILDYAYRRYYKNINWIFPSGRKKKAICPYFIRFDVLFLF